MNEIKETENKMVKQERKYNYEFEFNTLSIIYEKPADLFTKAASYFLMQRNKEKALEDDENEEEIELVECPTETVTKDDIDGLKKPPVEGGDLDKAKNKNINEDILDMGSNNNTTKPPIQPKNLLSK